jgi:hypothetical protein
VVRISVHLVEACVSRGRTVSVILALIPINYRHVPGLLTYRDELI